MAGGSARPSRTTEVTSSRPRAPRVSAVEVAPGRPGEVGHHVRGRQQAGEHVGAGDAGPGDLGLAAVAHQRGQVRVGVRQRQHVAARRWPPAARSASAWPARHPCRGRCRRPARRPGSCCRRPCPRRSPPGRGRAPRSGRRPARARLPACSSRSSRPPVSSSVASESSAKTPVLSRTGAADQRPHPAEPGGHEVPGARHPRQQGAGERHPAGLRIVAAGPDDLDAERVHPEPGQRRHVVQRLLQVERRGGARRRGRPAGPRPRPRPPGWRPRPLITAASSARLLSRVSESRTRTDGVVHRLVAAVGDRPGDVQRGADGRARRQAW